MKDRSYKVRLPRSDKVEQMLEEILPTEEVPQAVGVVQVVKAKELLTETDQRLIAKLYDALEVAHDQLAMACSLLGRLSRTLKLKQLMVVMKASIQPLFQLNAAAGLPRDHCDYQPELPEDQVEHVRILMTPDPEATLLKQEKINSPTRLLAVTFAFKVLKRFGGGTMQRKVQEMYYVWPKQLAECIRGKSTWEGATERPLKGSANPQGMTGDACPQRSQPQNKAVNTSPSVPC